MSLIADITINAGTTGGANVNNVYNFVNMGENSSLRRVQSTALHAPETLRISHQSVKRSSIMYWRHMFRFDLQVNDSIAGPVQVSSWCVTELPSGVASVTGATGMEILGRLHALMNIAGVKDKILAGES